MDTDPNQPKWIENFYFKFGSGQIRVELKDKKASFGLDMNFGLLNLNFVQPKTNK